MYSVSFSVDSPFVVCVGGEQNGIKVVDLSENAQGMHACLVV